MLETMVKGGVMMIPLMVCSVLALAVLIDRGWAFYLHSRIDNKALRARITKLLDAGRTDEAAVLCASTPGPTSAVLLAGLKAFARHRARNAAPGAVTTAVEKAMEDYSQRAISEVGKRLNVLSTVANAAPLLGMTGTVTGMILMFDELHSAGVGAAGVASGISEALITTAAGLLIALMAAIPYNVFTAMADKIALQIAEAGSELLDFVAGAMPAGAAPASPAQAGGC